MSVCYRKYQALQAATKSPWTKDLRHVQAALPRFWTRPSPLGPSVSAVRLKDRIKWWNIVPGDQVRVLGWEDTSLREVYAINRLNNRVLLKKEQNNKTNKVVAATDSVHYSRCQLYIGHHKFPPAPGSVEPRSQPVFAVRMGMTAPGWVGRFAHFSWRRFAQSTTPRLPGWTPSSKERIDIPWPTPEKSPEKIHTEYDTPLEVVAEVTYTPPPVPADPEVPPPALPSPQDYIRSLRSGETVNFPMEVHLARELTNPHSRAQKQKRWQNRFREEKELLETITKAEIKNLQGRTRKVARADAVWKWQQQLKEQRHADIVRKWLGPRREKSAKKKERKEKKQERINRNLRSLVLEDAANQATVIPSARRISS